MYFLTAYHWLQGEHFSLVLQQVRRKKGDLPILFACVGEDGEFTEGMAEWFGEKALPLCRRGNAERIAKRVGICFGEFVEAWKKAAGWGGFAALFCVGEECFYAWRGEIRILVLNMQFGRAQARRLTRWTEEYGLERAFLEENVGLFLGSAALCEKLPEEVFQSCLTANDLDSQRQADRHLADACGEADRRGAASTAAVLVVTKAGKKSRETGKKNVKSLQKEKSGISRAARKEGRAND